MNLIKEIKSVKTIIILGHVKPDGDCIGAATALYQYIKNVDCSIDVEIVLDDFINYYDSIPVINKIKTKASKKSYDLCITVDVPTRDRLLTYACFFDLAKKHIAIDHHVTNENFAEIMHVEPEASSTCEVLFYLFKKEFIDDGVAASLYTGLATDTGVFRYSNTTEKSFMMAAELSKYNIDRSKIVEDGFFSKSDKLNRFIAKCILNRKLVHNKRTIYTIVTKKMMLEDKITNTEFEGIVEALRDTKDVEVAIFAYEKSSDCYKISLRSKSFVDVSKICSVFNGGGHIRAAGCTLKGNFKSSFEGLLNKVKENYV